MNALFILLLALHGLIHWMGFAKAFHLGNVSQLTKEISKPLGILWLAAFLLFAATAWLFYRNQDSWCRIGLIAVVLSQGLILTVWQEAKFGTLANLIIGVVALLALGSIQFEKGYRQDVLRHQIQSNQTPNERLTESDLQDLPAPVQRYLRYAGVLQKPKVRNAKIVFEGEMRSKGKDYFPFTSEQYNFFEEPTRLFFMKGKMFGMTVPGYHKYEAGKASMDIRLFGLFSVQHHTGAVMDKTETVTLFNDMCLLAPATLIDKRIRWSAVNDTTVSAIFTNHGISIQATLTFNPQGQLLDFVSADRTAIAEMQAYPFSTPVEAYQSIHGYQLMSSGDAVWHYPDGKFTYGKFRLKDIQYNVE